MKKIVTMIVLLFLTATWNVQGQTAEKSWAFGFGFSYPKLTGTNTGMSNINYGGYLSVQRNFVEQAGIRLMAKYSHLEGTWGNNQSQTTTTESIFGSFDLIYYFIPCASFSPFIAAGIGVDYYSLDNPENTSLDKNHLELILNFGIGIEASLGENWKLKSELGIHSVGSSNFDGIYGTAGYGVFGTNTDAFMSFDLGLQYYFSKGAPSKLCRLYDGIQEYPDPVDYDRIENIVQKYIPQEVVKEVVVEKIVPMETGGRWVLVGVNFDFNSAKLKPEAYPVLFHAVQVLLQNSDIMVEIQGFTDNIGTEKSNLRMSQMRADVVKDYLVARGVSSSRLKAVGLGESNPIADNKTAKGRAMNRRIEFKVKN
ncbi:MAG: OmpA family protein [Melioribacteraceae bacterium]|nr:OmpA family protein [Melioribacteraceae bacterium]